MDAEHDPDEDTNSENPITVDDFLEENSHLITLLVFSVALAVYFTTLSNQLSNPPPATDLRLGITGSLGLTFVSLSILIKKTYSVYSRSENLITAFGFAVIISSLLPLSVTFLAISSDYSNQFNGIISLSAIFLSIIIYHQYLPSEMIDEMESDSGVLRHAEISRHVGPSIMIGTVIYYGINKVSTILAEFWIHPLASFMILTAVLAVLFTPISLIFMEKIDEFLRILKLHYEQRGD